MSFPGSGRALASTSESSPFQVPGGSSYTLGPAFSNESSSTRRNINPRPFVAPAPVGRQSRQQKPPGYELDGNEDYEVWQDEAEADVKREYDAGPSGSYELSEDGFEEVESLEVSRARSPDYGLPPKAPTSEAGPSNWESKAALQTALAQLEGEVRLEMARADQQIQSVAEQIEPLQKLHSTLLLERRDLMDQISSLSSVLTRGDLREKFTSNGKGRDNGHPSLTNYQSDEFEWSGQLKKTMKKVWGIDDFR